MPVPIVIDLSGLEAQFNLPYKTVDVIVEAAVTNVRNEIYLNWIQQAKLKLNSTRTDYTNSLLLLDKGRFTKSIVLVGKFNNMLEQGATAWDMKNGFAQSSKRKFSKDGKWYITIPFRIGAPGTIGENSAFSGVMPDDIHSLLLNRAAGSGLKKSELPSPYDNTKTRARINATKNSVGYASYTHKTPIYQGLQKLTGAYANTTQNTYGSFRRAGENSDPNSWIHKSIKAYNLADAAIKNTDVDKLANNTAMAILNDIL